MAIIQLSSANGPKECEIAIEKCLRFLISEAEEYQVSVDILKVNQSHDKLGYKSVLLALEGIRAEEFAQRWIGVHQWQCQSSVRKHHKRKNWIFGCQKVELEDTITSDILDLNDVSIKTCKASGAGGQHVNKTDSAVMLTHIPTGIQIKVSSRRSQHQNKQLGFKLLIAKLTFKQSSQAEQDKFSRRMHHHQIYPNVPVRFFKDDAFVEVF